MIAVCPLMYIAKCFMFPDVNARCVCTSIIKTAVPVILVVIQHSQGKGNFILNFVRQCLSNSTLYMLISPPRRGHSILHRTLLCSLSTYTFQCSVHCTIVALTQIPHTFIAENKTTTGEAPCY